MKLVLQFVTDKRSFVSAVIRWVTWSEYSHVDIVLPDGNLLGSRLSGGVQVRSPKYVHGQKILFVKVEVEDHVRVIDYARSQIGKPYDWRAILNFALHRRRAWKEDDSWFCSELVAWVFEQAGFPLLNTALDCDRVTPRDLLASPLVEY